MRNEQLTNAALLLFGKTPSRFFPTANVKCAVFHGLSKTKPIPSFKILEGDVFTLIDLAIEFVMSRLDFGIGTRVASNIAPGQYEIPREVVAEAIVNALAHRDYASNASVEIILYKNRLEITNPGSLPLGWTTDMLKQLHNSVPNNPLLAHPMYLAGYIEQLGTGTEDMIQRLQAYGLPEPQFVQAQYFAVTLFRTPDTGGTSKITGEVTGEVTGELAPQETLQDITTIKKVVFVLEGEMKRQQLQDALQIKHNDYFRVEYISPALEHKYIELKYPNSINHPKQKYRLTAKGQALKARLNQEL
jgi:ATP-dependent DNA helicase RecG